jgi:hypothetical protein
MNGGALAAPPTSLGTINTAWQIAGVGDFNGDSNSTFCGTTSLPVAHRSGK